MSTTVPTRGPWLALGTKHKARIFLNRLSGQQFLLISSALLLFSMALLPTLLVDYVPQDQWRAFTYFQTDETAGARLHACVDRILPFYVATGRPLVWPGECMEHMLVARITDFRRLRPFCFLIVTGTLMALAYALRGIAEDAGQAILIAAMLLYAPGFSFMYYQGVTAAPVLIAALLAALSFGLLVPLDFEHIRRIPLMRLSGSAVLFLLACFIYPCI